MRPLAIEEKRVLAKMRDRHKKEMDDYDQQEMKSNSAKKKMAARHHNEWTGFLNKNQIMFIFGKPYTSMTTPIEGSEYEIN
jgi:hypothetical protein